MSEGIEEAELAELEQRAARAFAIAPTPWVACLETHGGLGGESFIQLGDDPSGPGVVHQDVHGVERDCLA